jgi:hypothetical protein
MLEFLLLAVASPAPPPMIRMPVVREAPPAPGSPRPGPLAALARGVVRLLPSEAINKAADAAPAGVVAVFDMPVRRADFDRGTLYLNSETDYRDQRSLTISVPPRALPPMRRAFGDDFATRLKGQRILVLGKARRVRIDFTTNGRPTGKYYYQTHVLLTDPGHLKIVG